jgi:general nucleoside transport system permease protein
VRRHAAGTAAWTWPLRLERRSEPSTIMRIASSPLAALLMLLTGLVTLSALGKDPIAAFNVFFIEPFSSIYGIGELLLKATPLMLCALGSASGIAPTSGISARRGS